MDSRRDRDVDDVVVDAGRAELSDEGILGLLEEAVVHDDVAGDLLDSRIDDLSGEIAQHSERVPWHRLGTREAGVGVVTVDEA